ncbi:MAG TPA: YtcA family lipoprotein [Verrucomicrobiae bacterium]|nr:YtcA family lipoprotein [Verrucomicrobiae bacterium]
MNIGTKEQGRDQTSLIRPLVGLSLVVSLALAGCSHAPEYSIFGSFFPVWIFCSIGGLILATCGRAVIARTAMAEHLVAPVLLYISTAVFLACVLWLIFYS